MLKVSGLSRTVDGRALPWPEALSLGEGEILGVSGPSGAGKTLLLRAIAALDPVPGQRTLGGRSFEELGPQAWRARVRWLPQASPMLTSTGQELFERMRGITVLGAPGERPSLGLSDTTWRRPWAEASGGERQRMVLAIALAWPADVLLLDEPTSALDPDRTREVEELLAGRTAIWVSHTPEQLDRVATRRVHLT